MRRVPGFRVLLGLAIVLSMGDSVSRGQGPRGRSGAPAAGAGPANSLTNQLRLGTMLPQTPITVLMAPTVQKELKLTDAQKNQVYKLAIDSGDKQRDLFQTMQARLQAGAGVNPQEMIAARDQLRSENEQAIGRLLDKKQRERMGQIVLQLEGPLAVSRPEIADQLRLNPRQRDAVQATMMELAVRQRQLNMAARRQVVTFAQLDPSQFGQVRAQMARLRDSAVQQIGKIVDRKQQANFKTLLGEPFDLSRLDTEEGAAAGASEAKDPSAGASTKDETKSSDPEPSEKETPKVTTKPGRRKARSKSSSGS